MLAKAYSASVYGLNGYLVEVEVDICGGLPSLTIVGLPDIVVKEAKERVKTAIKNSDLDYPKRKVIVNLAPADMKKEGSSFDLPIAIAILTAEEKLPPKIVENFVFIAELGFDGRLRPVSGVLPIAIALKEEGNKSLVLPIENAKEAALVKGLNVYGMTTLEEVFEFLLGKIEKKPYEVDIESLFGESPNYELDFAEVKGQEHAKRALEIAAAGAHNILMIGPPGSGKTMLARRVPTILPDLTFEEAIQTTKIYSICAQLPPNKPLITQRPFRAPHNTISHVALVGGGTIPKPGEVSLSHNGVLFLDELPEFRRDTLEALRQPLEDGEITVSRASSTLTFPASFMLISSMNPCPCGYYGDYVKECSCSPIQIHKYLQKISGPLLDRIDIHIEVPRLTKEKITSNTEGESSLKIKARVKKAREIQRERYKGMKINSNSELSVKGINKFCKLNEESENLLKNAIEKLGLSARAYHRIKKISRTIADLEGREEILPQDVAESIQYRSLDRKFWV